MKNPRRMKNKADVPMRWEETKVFGKEGLDLSQLHISQYRLV